jgi:hypothetical protein
MIYLYLSFTIVSAVFVIFILKKSNIYFMRKKIFSKNEFLLWKMVKKHDRNYNEILEQIEIITKENKNIENKKKIKIRKEKLEKLKLN